MANNFENFQDKAISAINDFYFSKSKKGKMFLAAGLGKNRVISSAIEKIINKENCKILILGSYNEFISKIRDSLSWNMGEDFVCSCVTDLKENGVFVSSYHDILITDIDIDYEKFDLIICVEPDRLDSEYIYPFLDTKGNTKCLLFFSGISERNEYSDYECIFKYTIMDALENGYIVDKVDEDFVISSIYLLLDKLNYKNIKMCNRINTYNCSVCPDLMASKDECNYIFEVKLYRDLVISKNIIDNAINYVRNYQYKLGSENYSFILIMFCSVDSEYKREVYERYNIIIWDISNLLYLASGYENIYNLFIRAIPYFTSNIKREKPISFENEFVEVEVSRQSKYEEFRVRLDNCPFGNEENVSKEYEAICNDMIKYLFETEFFQMVPQHYTYDRVFRMDLICSLKGTTAFWKFLIDFYRTKFVVFEYKNYGEPISQNLIFVTEKYLLSAALRNVVFIISRKGFDRNANMMALSSLKNDNKLIVELTDEDMLSMVRIKEDGEEASDYLMNKVESILMSISK